jgi:hypothetical protein
LSRIAIIDTAIDAGYIGGKPVERINLCGGGENGDHTGRQHSHGTLCAMVLDYCAKDYELLNIQIFKENKAKVFGEIETLAEALKLCIEMNIDVVSLSAVSSILSDSKYLYDITHNLAENAVIVSALDNKRYVSVPTCYRHVAGVQSDAANILLSGELAYREDDPFGANIFAGCDFDWLRKLGHGLSNSSAVPVVAARVNDLLNQGLSAADVMTSLTKLKPYPVNEKYNETSYPAQGTDREIPVVFIADDTTQKCRVLMDTFHEKHGVQTSALSFAPGAYDARIRDVPDIIGIRNELRFMSTCYKTDVIFIVGGEDMQDVLTGIVDIDVQMIRSSGYTSIICEDDAEKPNSGIAVADSKVADELYRILTTQES